MDTKVKNDQAGPRAFGVFLQKVADGECHDQLSTELLALSKVLRDQSQAQAGAVKGSLALKLNFTSESGVLDVTYSIERKEPKPRRPRSTFWQDASGNVVDENPKQLGLGLRDVSKRGPAREAESQGGAARDA